MQLKIRSARPVKFRLKGQFKYISEIGLLLFFGHTDLKSIEEMSDIGIYLSDLNQFDGSAEMMVTEMLNNDNLKKKFEEVLDYVLLSLFLFNLFLYI
jgi:hypothetical protein